MRSTMSLSANRRIRSWVWGLGLSTLSMSAIASGATITFEQDPPYFPTAVISGKTDPAVSATWAGGSLSFVGFEGPSASPTARYLQTPATAAAANVRITPNPTAFGLTGTVLPATGTYDFNFDLRRGSDSTAISSNVATTIQIGRSTEGRRAAMVTFRTDGQLQFLDGSTGIPVTVDGAIPTASNRLDLDSVAAGQWVTVSGVMNYSAKTYTLKVNGVTQVNSSGNSVFNFRDSTFSFSDFGLIWVETANVADYRSLQVDNINLAIPEPASLSLLCAGAAALMLRRRTAQVR